MTPGRDFSKAAIQIQRGEQARSSAENYTYALARELGLNPELSVIRGDMKMLDRIIEKAHGRHEGQIEAVKDITRFRILFERPEQIEKLRSLMIAGRKSSQFNATWENRGVKVIEIEDNYLTPKSHGYIGYNLVVDVCLGKGRKCLVEIQMMHENMQLTDKVTRATYLEIRKIKETAKAEGRELTDNEEQIVKSYCATNKNLYEADALNYGLNILRKDYVAPVRYQNNVLTHSAYA